MHRESGGPNFAAVIAVLALLVMGFAAYAVPASAASGQPSNGPGGPPGGPPPGNGLSYALLPTPAYLHEQVPANYSFKQGGALVVASGDQLQVTASFLGAPKTTFTVVVQTASENYTVGTVTSAARGASLFKGNLTLLSGTYEVGLLIFVAGQPASPVGVSVPRAIQVTLSTAGQTSTITSTTSTANSSSAPQPQPQATEQLSFAPVTVPGAPASYLYGGGGGRFAIVGASVYFSLTFSGQNPSTQYSLLLSVNGSSKTIGQYTTDGRGDGSLAASYQLGAGTFSLGLLVVDSSTFSAPATVLASVPSNFTVTTGPAVSPSGGPIPARGLVWAFRLVQAANASVPQGYRFPSTGTAMVSFDPRSSTLNVVVGFQDANPATTYNAALVLNGTSVSLGTMTTNRMGGAILHSSVQESQGVYLMGVVVYDVSDAAAFNSAGPVLVLVSDPLTQVAALVPPNAVEVSSNSTSESLSSTSSTSSTSTTASSTTEPAVTIAAGNKVQDQIQDAVENLTIPATIQVTPLSTTTDVLDSRFSLSVGQQVGNGLVIAISGENVTGPRTLLINMSKTSPLALFPALNVTLDGSPVAEASSAVQVLNPVSGNPPLYVLVATSDSIQLLISIPHFSVHIIQVAGVIVHTVESSLELDAPVLAGSVVVVTLAIVATYAARKRYLAVLL